MSRQDRVGLAQEKVPSFPARCGRTEVLGGRGLLGCVLAAECLHLRSLRGDMGTGDPPAPQILQNPEL